jgi:hypothetical protein
MVSPDGHWRWDGTQWVPNTAPQSYASPPPLSGPGTTALGTVPAAASWTAPAPPPPAMTRGLAYQFSGDAMWSIIFGVASIAVPLFTPIFFPILPIFGVWRGAMAVRRGRVAGGVIGLIVSGIGCLASLLYSGLLNSLVH